MLKATWGLITRWTEGFLKFLLNDKSWGSSVQAFIHIFFCFWKNTTFCHSFKRDTTFFRLHIFFSFHLFFFWVDSITFHSNHFLYLLGCMPRCPPGYLPSYPPGYLLGYPPSAKSSTRIFIQLSDVSQSEYLTTSLSYPMAIFSANEILIFDPSDF